MQNYQAAFLERVDRQKPVRMLGSEVEDGCSAAVLCFAY
jgi:hypothetical protein